MLPKAHPFKSPLGHYSVCLAINLRGPWDYSRCVQVRTPTITKTMTYVSLILLRFIKPNSFTYFIGFTNTY
ncbi:hypothetical protein L6452_13279 [Arctium lappa]|uniref:Uncharacterized protein n=1 Tax=Arctium lappa TaxID=4217 RepID=A0ACB9CHS1_ARCLA|nr:hypothetical protein L6452_13279 [Arctium lappa]